MEKNDKCNGQVMVVTGVREQFLSLWSSFTFHMPGVNAFHLYVETLNTYLFFNIFYCYHLKEHLRERAILGRPGYYVLRYNLLQKRCRYRPYLIPIYGEKNIWCRLFTFSVVFTFIVQQVLHK